MNPDRYYDVDDPHPPSTMTHSQPYRPAQLRCDGCQFRGPVTEAVSHHLETGHVLTLQGVPQDFSAFQRRA